MKKLYLVACHPEITGHSKLANFSDREELMSMLGFCAAETRAEKTISKEELQEVSWIQTHFADLRRVSKILADSDVRNLTAACLSQVRLGNP